MAVDVEGGGAKDDPWILTTPPGKSEFEAWREPDADPPALVIRGGIGAEHMVRRLDEIIANGFSRLRIFAHSYGITADIAQRQQSAQLHC